MKEKRKGILVLAGVVVCSLCITIGVLAAGISQGEQNQTMGVNNSYVDFAMDVVEKYYKNKDLDENKDFSGSVTQDLLRLLNTKI